jgi:hypothetical protein
MKQTRKILIISLMSLLSCALLANHRLHHSAPQAVKLINPTPLVTTPPASPNLGLNDIAHTDQAGQQSIKKSWLKDSEIKEILTKARRNGRLDFVMAKLEKMHLPKSLALIPVIESEYSTRAKSNKGASGIWQLMPCTAKRFGIKTNQRYELEPSTNAALQYFKELHQKFGNWELAIAAYNAGEGRIQKALDKNPNAANVQELKLPKETKQYVLKFYMLEDYVAHTSTA